MAKTDKYYRLKLASCLLALSVIAYVIHWLVFRDLHHIMLYLIGDLAFLFIQVLLVTLIIEEFLNDRDRRAKFQKLNMVIGAFFSEVGNPLLEYFIQFDGKSQALQEHLLVNGSWDAKHFEKARRTVTGFAFEIDAKTDKLAQLKPFLMERREAMLRLLENPTLLEHETFTELLWAVFHLTEELACRKTFDAIADSDLNHLAGDIKRAYPLLIEQWLNYLEHLKRDYPYLFSLAVRTNPFNPQACAEVKN